MLLSVALATYNEEKNLGRCLEAVKNIADEIIVVDGSSTDQTVQIAKKHHAKVIITDNPAIFHINKQKAIDLCQGKWILQLDADEVVSPDLAAEIVKVINSSQEEISQRQFLPQQEKLFKAHQQIIESRNGAFPQTGEYAAFFIPRKNLFLGGFLMHGGVYPDGVIRLIKNGQAKFPCKSVHEQIHVSGRVGWLQHDLLHYATPTFSDYLLRSNRYTTLTAAEFDATKLPVNLLTTLNYLVIKPGYTFFSLFFRHRGFLDGFPGFVFALFSGFHHATSYLKYIQEQSFNHAK